MYRELTKNENKIALTKGSLFGETNFPLKQESFLNTQLGFSGIHAGFREGLVQNSLVKVQYYPP